MKEKDKVSIFWFRRDLRLTNNRGLYEALLTGVPILPIFIFDKNILEKISIKSDRRVDYIHQALTDINTTLKSMGCSLRTFYGTPKEIFKTLMDEFDIQNVFCNRDYEPYAIKRDTEIYNLLREHHIGFHAYKDQVVFDKHDIVKKDGSPYTVYSPYAAKWRERLASSPELLKSYPKNFNNLYTSSYSNIHSLTDIGFLKTDMSFSPPQLKASIIDEYDKFRDYPAMKYTTQLGIALRFGTISARECIAFAWKHNETWLSELIWREFFMQILYHFPDVVHVSFKKAYDHIQWRNDEDDFKKWCAGKTGYPLVDAGMRELNETGYMHNRVRMVAASFLCKHLLIDWRWGETYFAAMLNDYDLAANNGNWQWAAGSGCDAAPYFRIFNPITQAKKFDKNLDYIKNWLPEFGTPDYPEPIVDHSFARKRALHTYQRTLK